MNGTLHSTVAIIGSGFGGQSAAITLRRLGIDDFRLFERRPVLGGTWVQNRYPGAAVDVQSPLYCLADEPWDWTRMFAEQAELEAYTRHVIEKHGLADRTCASTNVEALTWDAGASLWHLRTSGDRTFTARFVINASGPLSNPLVPPFPGREAFAGRAFHTNAWDPTFDVRGKRVAVVGSGASAAQVIPAIAPDVAALHVFQRTPHWVLPRPDHTFTPAQRALLRNPLARKALRQATYWSLESRILGLKYSKRLLRSQAERLALQHLHTQVPDAKLRARLTPDYLIGCKRVILSNTLYPALCRQNVTLHDRSDAIARIDEDGIHTVGQRYVPLDAIVWATGYDASDGAIPYPVTGVGGVTLAQRWDPFPRAYLGTTVPGLPNFFIVTGPNTGIGHTSAIFIIESQMRYIGRCVEETLRRGASTIEVRPEAEDRWTRSVHERMKGTAWQEGGCRSWYQSRSGHVVAIYPGFSFEFRAHTSRFRPTDHTFS